MNKAIWVVLLLPKALNDLCVEINNSHPKNSYIRFSEDWPPPHISLNQTILSDSEIQQLIKSLEQIKIGPITLKDFWIKNFTSSSSWSEVSYLVFESKNLKAMHEKVMSYCSGFERKEAKQDHFLFSDDASDGQLAYISEFEEKYAYENYAGHITLGKWHDDSKIEITNSQCTQLWVFHLGPNWTCQEVLYKKIIIDT